MSEARLAVLASGGGSNLQAILEASARGDLHARVVLVVSNNSASGARARARAVGITTEHISATTHEDPDLAIAELLTAHSVDWVVLAGWMKRIGPHVLARFSGRVLNIHPAPLPAFGGQGMYGDRVHAAVIASGVPQSGPTVHRVDGEYDHGEVLAHQPVPVLAGDTSASLAERVISAEHQLYWRVIEAEVTRANHP